jgi:hypothetical protein
VNATEPTPQKPTVPESRDAEIIALLQKIVELLDDLDGSLANICGELGSIDRNLAERNLQ